MPAMLRRAYSKAARISHRVGGQVSAAWHNRRVAVLRRRASGLLDARSRPLRLHIGCGANYWPDWLNLDNRRLPKVDLVWDLTDGLPLPDESCELIYSEHVLEHLPIENGVGLLRECHRVLAAGGTMRIAMPALEYLVQKYHSVDWQDQDWLRLPEYQFIRTPAEMLNVAFRWWGHEWLYDREELDRRLIEVGFTHPVSAAWGESEVPELRARETRPDSRLICEVRKERPAR